MDRLTFFKTLFLGSVIKKKPEEENRLTIYLKGSDLILPMNRSNLNLNLRR